MELVLTEEGYLGEIGDSQLIVNSRLLQNAVFQIREQGHYPKQMMLHLDSRGDAVTGIHPHVVMVFTTEGVRRIAEWVHGAVGWRVQVRDA